MTESTGATPGQEPGEDGKAQTGSTDTQTAAGKASAENLPLLTREQILGANDHKTETVNVPEWGGAVEVQSLSLGQRQEIRKRSTVEDEVDDEKFDLYAFMEGVVQPQFQLDDFEALKAKNGQAMQRVMSRIMVLAGWTVEATKEAEKSTSS